MSMCNKFQFIGELDKEINQELKKRTYIMKKVALEECCFQAMRE